MAVQGITRDSTSHIVPNSPSIDDDKPLFSPSLISPTVLSFLPENYTMRPLRRSDYYAGFLDVLRVLTSVGDVSIEDWNARYDWMAKRNDEYFLLVICNEEGRVVGTGSLIVERKFIHSLGMVGHVEDIAIEKGQQGKKLGLRMIQALDYMAKRVGCYKVRGISCLWRETGWLNSLLLGLLSPVSWCQMSFRFNIADLFVNPRFSEHP
jgi:glucosamine-phosphate N-acetyltransferase